MPGANKFSSANSGTPGGALSSALSVAEEWGDLCSVGEFPGSFGTSIFSCGYSTYHLSTIPVFDLLLCRSLLSLFHKCRKKWFVLPSWDVIKINALKTGNDGHTIAIKCYEVAVNILLFFLGGALINIKD